MKGLTILLLIFSSVIVFSCDSVIQKKEEVKTMKQIVWNVDNLEIIGGHKTTIEGTPKVIDTPKGKAVLFEGEKNALFVDVHPLEGAETFTLEIIFRPDGDAQPETRFFHLQENDSQNRFLVELRITEENEWYLDTYIKSDETSCTLICDALKHPCGEWYNATLIYDGTEMRHYVNGVKEMSTMLRSFTPPKAGRTSIGCRINKVAWFKGAISKARLTYGVLSPEDFLKP